MATCRWTGVGVQIGATPSRPLGLLHVLLQATRVLAVGAGITSKTRDHFTLHLQSEFPLPPQTVVIDGLKSKLQKTENLAP